MDTDKNREIKIADETAELIRIDKYLSQCYPQWSRSYLQKLLKDQQILINEKSAKANTRLHSGDRIVIDIPPLKDVEILPENIPLDILYEDDYLLIVNKPKGMVVHPAPGHTSGTLVNAVMYHCGEHLSGINGELRPGIVHRIDRDTTGALVICKDDNTHRKLAEQLKVHSITRKYRAIVCGRLSADGTVTGNIGRHPVDRKKMAINVKNGKPAVTHYHILQSFSKYTYVECQLETGRTHQIRVHMSSIGHPILGDAVYGRVKCPFHLEGQVLHAMVLGFIHPATGEYLEVTAPLPEYFTSLLARICE